MDIYPYRDEIEYIKYSIVADEDAPQKERKPTYHVPFKVKNGKRYCRFCNKLRAIDETPCAHCEKKDAFCVKGIQSYA